MELRAYRKQDLPAFRLLVARYFREDLHLPLTDTQADELARDIAGETRLGVPLTLAVRRGTPVGFIDYQIDRPGGSWCFHPGWGCIRECYVQPEERGRGTGAALAKYAVGALGASGAAALYLTADDAIPFWQHLGFSRTGHINDKNGLEELEMQL